MNGDPRSKTRTRSAKGGNASAGADGLEGVITHDGKFHADEVLAVAMLCVAKRMPVEELPLTRTRDKNVVARAKGNPRILVLDVGLEHDPGMGNYDHHQEGFAKTWVGGRTRLSTAGLIWEAYGHQAVAEVIGALEGSREIKQLDPDRVVKAKDVVEAVYWRFVAPVDAVDNGNFEVRSDVSTVLGMMNAAHALTHDQRFKQAVEMARQLLLAKIRETIWDQAGQRKFEDAMDAMDFSMDGAILELERPVDGQRLRRWLRKMDPNQNVKFVLLPAYEGWQVWTMDYGYERRYGTLVKVARVAEKEWQARGVRFIDRHRRKAVTEDKVAARNLAVESLLEHEASSWTTSIRRWARWALGWPGSPQPTED